MNGPFFIALFYHWVTYSFANDITIQPSATTRDFRGVLIFVKKTAWWLTYPLKNTKVSWDDDIPN
jgi:hypothetical protein